MSKVLIYEWNTRMLVSQTRYDPLCSNTGRHLCWILDNADSDGYLLHAGFLAWLILRPWRWRRHVPLKSWLIFNGLHGVISPKTELSINTIYYTLLLICDFRFPTVICDTFQACNFVWQSLKQGHAHTHTTLLTPDIFPLSLFFGEHTQQRIHLPSTDRCSLCYK
jgi:hypothetical protein